MRNTITSYNSCVDYVRVHLDPQSVRRKGPVRGSDMDSSLLVAFVQERLKLVSDPEKAVPMAEYMKTNMPFYGVQKTGRVPVYREMRTRFRPRSVDEYQSGIRALWGCPNREEKYTAIEYAIQNVSFITMESLELYEYLIRDGAWWDFVDLIAARLVGHLLLDNRETMRRVLDDWIDDENMWIRRSAILSQLKHKSRTDEEQLFGYCLRRSHETEFFVRKAIGWSLREYSKTAPETTASFLLQHRTDLSGLSYREGCKHLTRVGAMPISR